MSALCAAFAGPVRCEVQSGAVGLALNGVDRETNLPLQVLFSGVTDAPTLPATLRDVEIGAGAADRWELHAGGQRYTLGARALHRHVDAAAPFYRVVNLPNASIGRRLQWAVLFTVLRLPGAGRLLRLIKN